MEEKNNIFEISWQGVFKIFILISFLLILIADKDNFPTLYRIRNVLVWTIFALIISFLLNPFINFLKRFKIPRFLGVLFVYLIFFGILTLIVYLTLPFFIEEIKNFSQAFSQYFEKISPILKGIKLKIFQDIQDIESLFSALINLLNEIKINMLSILFAFFGGIFATTFILTMSIYFSLDERLIERSIVLFFPEKYHKRAILILEKCQEKISAWFFSRIMSCLFVAFLSFLVFLIFEVPYSYSLSLIAGFLNFIPIVGPILTGIILFLIIGLNNFTKGVFVIIVFILIQQIENNIFTPLISKKMIGLPPVLVLLSLTIGGILWGFLGAILAIPLAGILYEFLKEFLERKRAEKNLLT